MKAWAALFVLLGPVVSDNCGKPDEEKTCIEICKAKLKKPVYRVEVLGKTGADQWRVCACYTERIVVVDDLPQPVEKPENANR